MLSGVGSLLPGLWVSLGAVRVKALVVTDEVQE